MAATVQGWNLTPTRPLPSPSKPLFACWAISHSRPTFLSAYASGGKGFGELLKQKKPKGKEKETPVSSLSPSRGFGSKKGSLPSKENEDDEVSLDAGVDSAVCPCGGGENKLGYTECCMPYHNGTAFAPDGLTLLRARFSAYARGIVGYVASTTHPENPDFGDNLLANVQATCEQLRFYKLDVMHHEPISDRESTVSFRVVYGWRKGGQEDRRVMEEKSYFLREGDTWFFKDGEALSKASEVESSMASPANKSGSEKAAAGFGTKSSSRPRKS